MLQINMADVMNVIGSLTPYLIAIGVLFVLALIVTFAVNKKTVKEVATRKIIHSESWLVALVGIVVAVSMMLSGPIGDAAQQRDRSRSTCCLTLLFPRLMSWPRKCSRKLSPC